MGNQAMNEKYYTVKEAAELLKINPATVYRAVKRSQITFLRIGGAIRIPERAFDEFLHPAKLPEPTPPPRRIITKII